MNFYPDSHNGGIETVTRILSEQFYQKGLSVHIRYLFDSTYTHTDDSIFKSCEKINKSKIAQQIHDTVKSHHINIIINQCGTWISSTIKKSIEELNCSLITAYHNKPTLAPPTIKNIIKYSQTPFIKKIFILSTYPLFAYRSRRKLKKSHQDSYLTSDYTILLSKCYIDEYSKMMGIDSKKIVYLNNPIRDDLKLNDQDILNKEKIVLMVTRLDEQQKCIIKALKIWDKISKEFSDWKLQIVGSGPDEEKIKKFAQNKNIKNVEFLPAQNPEELYRKAAIFLMTSRNEGWPNTLNEAMRLACVPIAIDTFSAVYDIINHRANGIIIRQSSEDTEIKDCSMAILELIKNQESRNEMAQNAREKTLKFSAKVIAKKWIKLFEDCLLQH